MARRKSKKKTALASQPDPRAPLDSQLLLQHLAPALEALEIDLLKRVDESPGLMEALQARCDVERNAERTADELDPWRRGVITQVAAAWVLSCVFVRILEDRGLLEQCRIAGIGAEGSQQEYMKFAPFLTERDYLLFVFRELCHFEVTRELFDEKHNLVWRITPSAEGARALLAVFRQGGAEAPAFRFGQANARFLGDLYQDLSESVRAKYALLQTPDFVERFILDRTLEPALETFGLDGTTLLDPTCGSGHFLLGAFERLFDRQLAERPSLNPREAAARALGAVYGVDINPYAVSIAKCRLVLAFLEKGEFTELVGTPRAPLNVVVADSLLHKVAGEQPGQTEFGYLPGLALEEWLGAAFALEKPEEAIPILARRHAAVVGNPPYITVKDAARRDKYRSMYASAAGKYSLAAPFAERFFGLACEGGFVGMITANSFMKREFGKPLIQNILSKLDLQLVVNASGAYIPGHGTPTVLLFGRNRSPEKNEVGAVLAKRGEPSTPDCAAEGKVWSSIAAHVDHIGFENDYVSIVGLDREGLGKHPWSLGGGGAAELKELIEERSAQRLVDIVDDIGFASFTGLDDAFILPCDAALRLGVEEDLLRPMVIGECVRDWVSLPQEVAITPYDSKTQQPRPYTEGAGWSRFLWRCRACSEGVKSFGGRTRKECGESWWTWYRWQAKRYLAPLRITFAFVATHNHFVLDRGGKVFNRSAPIIKLPEGATEDDHYALLAYLNSSTAAFYLRQCGHSKGAQGVNEGHKAEVWEQFLEYSGGLVASLPVPEVAALCSLGRQMVALADERLSLLGCELNPPIASRQKKEASLLSNMCVLQEWIDWEVYRAFGVVSELEFKAAVDWLRSRTFKPGERPFERTLARAMAAGERSAWFSRSGYDCPSEGSQTPIEKCIEDNRNLRLLERPEHKRRWGLADLRDPLI